MVAGLTGEMLGEIFCWREDEWQEELRTLGFYMGKFIYIMDAYEDYDEDRRKRSTIHSSMRCGRVRMTWIRSAVCCSRA